MPILFWVVAALGAAFVFGKGFGQSVQDTTETDEGVSDSEGGSLFDTLSQAMESGAKQVQAYAHGVAIGLIEVWPIGGGFYLRKDAAQSAVRLIAKAKDDGVTLQTDSAFRFMEEQQSLYSKLQAGIITTPVAKPGYSNHQNGIAWDIAVQRSMNSPTYIWLAANAPDYGWTNTGRYFSNPEYWHWEYNPQGDMYG